MPGAAPSLVTSAMPTAATTALRSRCAELEHERAQLARNNDDLRRALRMSHRTHPLTRGPTCPRLSRRHAQRARRRWRRPRAEAAGVRRPFAPPEARRWRWPTSRRWCRAARRGRRAFALALDQRASWFGGSWPLTTRKHCSATTATLTSVRSSAIDVAALCNGGRRRVAALRRRLLRLGVGRRRCRRDRRRRREQRARFRRRLGGRGERLRRRRRPRRSRRRRHATRGGGVRGRRRRALVHGQEELRFR